MLLLLSLLLYWAWKEEALLTNGFWNYDLLRMCKQMSLPQPTDGPHKLWILKWISKIKVQTIDQYSSSSSRRRRRRRIYHLLQCPSCMLSFGMSIDQMEHVIWHYYYYFSMVTFFALESSQIRVHMWELWIHNLIGLIIWYFHKFFMTPICESRIFLWIQCNPHHHFKKHILYKEKSDDSFQSPSDN